MGVCWLPSFFRVVVVVVTAIQSPNHKKGTMNESPKLYSFALPQSGRGFIGGIIIIIWNLPCHPPMPGFRAFALKPCAHCLIISNHCDRSLTSSMFCSHLVFQLSTDNAPCLLVYCSLAIWFDVCPLGYSCMTIGGHGWLRVGVCHIVCVC